MSYCSYSIDLDFAPENLFVGNVLNLRFCLAIKYADILQE